MSAEREDAGQLESPAPQRDEPVSETLTDLIDRMDREAFRRALEQRDIRVVSARMRTHR